MRSLLLATVAVLAVTACASDPESGIGLPSVASPKGDGDLVVRDRGPIEADTYAEGHLDRSTADVYTFHTYAPSWATLATIPVDQAHIFDDGTTEIVLYHFDGVSWNEIARDATGGQNAWSEIYAIDLAAGDYGLAVIGRVSGSYRLTWSCVGTACSAALLRDSCVALDHDYSRHCADSGDPRACAVVQVTGLGTTIGPDALVDLCCSQGPAAGSAPYCQ